MLAKTTCHNSTDFDATSLHNYRNYCNQTPFIFHKCYLKGDAAGFRTEFRTIYCLCNPWIYRDSGFSTHCASISGVAQRGFPIPRPNSHRLFIRQCNLRWLRYDRKCIAVADYRSDSSSDRSPKARMGRHQAPSKLSSLYACSGSTLQALPILRQYLDLSIRRIRCPPLSIWVAGRRYD